MDYSIDLRQLRYFMAVSKALNFSRAADSLHISQPPLSRQIRQLEEQLGVALFTRTPAGVSLTSAGAAFLPEVKRTLVQAEKAIAAARAASADPGDKPGRFALGYTTVFDRGVLGDVLETFAAQHPQWRHTVKGKHSISLIRDLKTGALDAALIGLNTAAGGLVVETVYEEPVVVAISSRHVLAKKRSIGLDNLRSETLFWFARRLNPGFYDHCQQWFERQRFAPRTAPEPPDHHILLGLIAEGEGFALIPASLQAVKRQGVVFRPLKHDEASGPPLTMGMAVAYAAGNASPPLPAFLALVRRLMREKRMSREKPGKARTR